MHNYSQPGHNMASATYRMLCAIAGVESLRQQPCVSLEAVHAARRTAAEEEGKVTHAEHQRGGPDEAQAWSIEGATAAVTHGRPATRDAVGNTRRELAITYREFGNLLF